MVPTKTGKADRMGATFAERKAAREGVAFEPAPQRSTGNSTFAERSGPPASKAVDVETPEVEDKAVARKQASKKS